MSPSASSVDLPILTFSVASQIIMMHLGWYNTLQTLIHSSEPELSPRTRCAKDPTWFTRFTIQRTEHGIWELCHDVILVLSGNTVTWLKSSMNPSWIHHDHWSSLNYTYGRLRYPVGRKSGNSVPICMNSFYITGPIHFRRRAQISKH